MGPAPHARPHAPGDPAVRPAAPPPRRPAAPPPRRPAAPPPPPPRRALPARPHSDARSTRRLHARSIGAGGRPPERAVHWQPAERAPARPGGAAGGTLPPPKRLQLSPRKGPAAAADSWAGADPMSAEAPWEAFRSPKPRTFDYDPEAFSIPATDGRTVTQIVLDKRPDNAMVWKNAFGNTTAFCDVARPLALNARKDSVIPRVAIPPPPKGRRNLNSRDFVEALTHDFVPMPRAGQLPNDVTYSIWTGAGELGGRVKAGIAASLPFKEYCGKVHPAFFEEAKWTFRPPVDLRKLRKADADIFGAVPDVNVRY